MQPPRQKVELEWSSSTLGWWNSCVRIRSRAMLGLFPMMVIKNYPIKRAFPHTTKASKVRFLSSLLRWSWSSWFLLPTTDRYAAYFSMTLLKFGFGMRSTVSFYLHTFTSLWTLFQIHVGSSFPFYFAVLTSFYRHITHHETSPANIYSLFLSDSPGASRSGNNLELSITRDAFVCWHMIHNR